MRPWHAALASPPVARRRMLTLTCAGGAPRSLRSYFGQWLMEKVEDSPWRQEVKRKSEARDKAEEVAAMKRARKPAKAE